MDKIVQDMLGTAAEYLIQGKAEDVGNQPQYPTMVIFCGDITCSHYLELKRNLDLNWGRYAKHIPYVKISAGADGELYAKDLMLDEKGNHEEVCRNLINQMLALPSAFFKNRSRIKIECLISSEEDWDKYSGVVEKIGNNYAMTTLKTLYLMAEQETPEKKAKAKVFIEKLYKELGESSDTSFKAVYLLSNYLDSNYLLVEKNLEKNYRLVANLILLGGNARSDSEGEDKGTRAQFTSEIYGGASVFKTASYAIKEKPVFEIVVNSVEYMLEEVMRRQYETYRPFKDVRKELGIESRRISYFEQRYKEIERELPDREAMYGFPKIKGKFPGDLKGFERQNCGASRLFFERYFIQEGVERWLAENGEAGIHELLCLWKNKLSLSEIKRYFISDELRDSIDQISFLIAAGKGDGESRAYSMYQEEAKKYFYEKMSALLLNCLKKEYEKCLAFEKIYRDMQEMVADNNYCPPDVRRSIQSCYNPEINAFLEKMETELFRGLLAPEMTKEELAKSILGWFEKLADEKEIYRMSFEKELLKRVKEKSKEDQPLYLQKELEGELKEELKKSRRIHLLCESSPETVYYMINEDAEYAKMLKHDHTSEYIFDLNRTDCIEKIAVIDIADMNNINFMEE